MIKTQQSADFRQLLRSAEFVIMCILYGWIIGLFAGVIGSLIYLMILFPLVLGFIGGRIIIDNANHSKIRERDLIRVTTISMALVLYISMFYGRYFVLQVQTALLAFDERSIDAVRAAKVVVDYALKQEVGYHGLLGYILFLANQGLSIGRLFRTVTLDLGPAFTWIYWLIEFGVILWIMLSLSREILKKPYCSHCNAWYEEKKHIGGIPLARRTEIMDLIKLKDYAAVGRALKENASMPSLEFYLQRCPTCDTSISHLSISYAQMMNGRLAFVDVLNTTLTPDEGKQLSEAFAPSNVHSGEATGYAL